MSSKTARKRVSRDQWFQAALDILLHEGEQAVKIERMARDIGVAKTGFYWHFKDRAELMHEMLAYWEREYTSVLAENPVIAALAPQDRLLAISELVSEHALTAYDQPMAAWAKRDEKVAVVLEHIYATRSATVGGAFRELGFRGDDLEMRTRLFVCYHSNENVMFGAQLSAKARRMRRLRIKLLTQALPED